jgi:predicted RNA-binding protein with PIN domain
MPLPIPDIILLVDGYNVIGSCPNLQALQRQISLEAARTELIELLTGYSAFRGYQTHLVFDAHGRSGLGVEESITDSLRVYFTAAGQTADSHIEIFCAQARSRVSRYGRIIVATSDRAQQLTIQGYGAEWLSAAQLLQEIQTIETQIRGSLRSQSQQSRRRLAASLKPDAKKKLEQLRLGLDPRG